MSERLKVGADIKRCMGTGMCALTAPEVFAQRDEDGLVIVEVAEPQAALHAAVRAAAYNCPSGAIELSVTESA